MALSLGSVLSAFLTVFASWQDDFCARRSRRVLGKGEKKKKIAHTPCVRSAVPGSNRAEGGDEELRYTRMGTRRRGGAGEEEQEDESECLFT